MKKILIGVVAVAIAAVAVFYFIPSKSAKSSFNSAINPAFGEYISSYTAGVIGSGLTIRIALSQDVVDSLAIGAPTSAKLFDFSPAVKAKPFG
ncbi:MAG: hypothetical protein IPK96_10210 [Flammeovirgaceae bacterium]|nr:hypothetical protein [Flammeovirgaceae bacterium]